MDVALPQSLSWPPAARRARWRPGRTYLVAATLFLLTIVRAHQSDSSLASAVGPYRFNLVAWEERALGARLVRILPPLLGQTNQAPTAEPLRAYFAASTPDERQRLRPAAEAAIEAEVSREATAEGLALPLPWRAPLLFPPVSTWIGPPPQVLIVSPRERIEVRESVLLDPDTPLSGAEAVEARADATGVSSLVVPVGGLSTYPSMVLDSPSPEGVIAAAAHEWTHGYLFFHPLGQAYFASYDSREINETVADLVGRELATRIVRRLGLSPPPAPPAQPTKRGFDFNRFMRDTRREVDRLLANGQVADAERYMEQRRQELNAAGFAIRKLNQAYFAFYGSYTEGPAASSVSPIPDQVHRLRAQSGSLGEFLRRVALLRTAADLAHAVGDS